MQELSPNHWCCYIDGQNIDASGSATEGIYGGITLSVDDGRGDDGGNCVSNDERHNAANDDERHKDGTTDGDFGDDSRKINDHNDNSITVVEEQEQISAMENNIILSDNQYNIVDMNSTFESSTSTKKRSESSLGNDDSSSCLDLINESSTESYKRFKSSNINSNNSSSSSSDGFTVVDAAVQVEGEMDMKSTSINTKESSVIRVNSYTFINSSYYVYDETNDNH